MEKLFDSLPYDSLTGIKVSHVICAVLGNSIRWLRHIGGVSIGQTVVIVGPGLQGISAAAVAKESGADPIIVIGLSRGAGVAGQRLEHQPQ